VSLSDEPEEEVRVGWDLLKALGIRHRGVKVISCASCARQGFNVIETVRTLEDRLAHIETPLTLSIIGCVVNGPGEALMTDIGLTGGGNGRHMIYRAGKTDHDRRRRHGGAHRRVGGSESGRAECGDGGGEAGGGVAGGGVKGLDSPGYDRQLFILCAHNAKLRERMEYCDWVANRFRGQAFSIPAPTLGSFTARGDGTASRMMSSSPGTRCMEKSKATMDAAITSVSWTR
jgi:hypothetical protein